MKKHQKQLTLFPGMYVKERQPELFPLSHESTCPRRQTQLAERVYATKWKEKNDEEMNRHDYQTLEMIMQADGQSDIPYVSDRDSIVAASVIQWLGTNNGMCFVNSCEDDIDEKRNIRRSFQPSNYDDVHDKKPPICHIRQQLFEIVAAYIPAHSHACSSLQREVLTYVLRLLRDGLPMAPLPVRSAQRVILKHPNDPRKVEQMAVPVQAALDEVLRTMREM